MKIRKKRAATAKPTPPATSAEVVDALGEEYEDANTRATTAGKEATDAKNRIKELARTYGKKDDQGRVLLEGDDFLIGYSVPNPTPSIDAKLAELNLPADVFAQCQVKVFDPNTATRLFAKGKIPPKVFQKCMVTKDPSPRIYVKKKDK